MARRQATKQEISRFHAREGYLTRFRRHPERGFWVFAKADPTKRPNQFKGWLEQRGIDEYKINENGEVSIL